MWKNRNMQTSTSSRFSNSVRRYHRQLSALEQEKERLEAKDEEMREQLAAKDEDTRRQQELLRDQFDLEREADRCEHAEREGDLRSQLVARETEMQQQLSESADAQADLRARLARSPSRGQQTVQLPLRAGVTAVAGPPGSSSTTMTVVSSPIFSSPRSPW